MSTKLSKRIPDILLESLFIVAALLGALALDEWREDKQRQELAERAKAAILLEMRDNKKQLDEKLPEHKKMLETLAIKLKQYEKDKSKSPDFDFNYSMALLSSAAWDTARMTQSAQFISFDDVRDFSKIYQFQKLYSENQQKLIEKIMEIGGLEDAQFIKFTKGFIHRLKILIEINETLSDSFAKTAIIENPLQNSAKK